MNTPPIRSIETLSDDDGMVIHFWGGDKAAYKRRVSGDYYWTHMGNTSAQTLDGYFKAAPGYFDALGDMYRVIRQMHGDMLKEVEKRFADLRSELARDAAIERRALNMHAEQVQKEYHIGRHPALARWRQAGARADAETPECLREVRHVKRLDSHDLPCHVYFLLRAGVVVYVGQTSKAWPLRILDHIEEGMKEFDDVWYLEVDRPSLSDVEATYIRQFRPQYNANMPRAR